MGAMIPEVFISELLNRLDIVEVVQRFVPLKKSGANYSACCPFHNEKTPSFTVSANKQFYHCFGCGAHGSVIGFVMRHQGLPFVEAVQELADSVGLAVPSERPAHTAAQAEQEPDLGANMQRAARYYREQLKRSADAIGYLKSRGLSGEIAARFGIGYAPPGWQNLAEEFGDYQSQALLHCGLVVEGGQARRYDRFRNRIMFPVWGRRDQVVGFGGRVLPQEFGGSQADDERAAREPKYLNSPETVLFSKGRELYGLRQAAKAIRAHGRVLVVEGYMDVVALAQHGVENAVATLGTAVTGPQISALMRQCDDIAFCFDGDEAGRRAAWRALEGSLPLVGDGKRLSFLFLPQDEDPDSYVRKNGKSGFEQALAQALPLSEFLLRELSARTDTQSSEGRARLLRSAQPLLAKINAPALRLLLEKRVAELAGLTQSELAALHGRRATGAARVRTGRQPLSLARQLLRIVAVQPQVAGKIGPDTGFLGAEGELGALAEVVEFIRTSPNVVNTAFIVERFRDTPAAGYLEQALLEQGREFGNLDETELEQQFEHGWTKLAAQQRRRRYDELTKRTTLNDEDKRELLELHRGLEGARKTAKTGTQS
ncbi:MAG: DNA primase [Burkholderiales bacterium]